MYLYTIKLLNPRRIQFFKKVDQSSSCISLFIFNTKSLAENFEGWDGYIPESKMVNNNKSSSLKSLLKVQKKLFYESLFLECFLEKLNTL